MELIERIKRFLTVDVWHIEKGDVPPARYFLYSVVKKVYLTVSSFIDKGVASQVSALTYSTLLAVVPIVAVVFAIARGFGFSKYIEEWFRDAMASQPQAGEVIIGFVNSYLVHTHSGVFIGVGLLFMLWTLINLIRNIEMVFNAIWQVKAERNLARTIADYMALFFLMPLVIVVTSGISIFMATIAQHVEGYLLLGGTMRFIIDLLPYVIMSGVFIGLYIFMPNTRVKFTAAIVPGTASQHFCISAARRETSFRASSKDIAPAATRAENSPRECPATISGANPGVQAARMTE